jgi:hypothetical protein
MSFRNAQNDWDNMEDEGYEYVDPEDEEEEDETE